MKKWSAFAAGMIVAGAYAGHVLAQPAELQDWKRYIQASCGKEIQSLCKPVRTGEGRLIACLFSREDKLSPKCGDAVLNSMTRLGVVIGALANVRRVCERDAKQLCGGIIAGEGNLLGCLTVSKKSVSAECNATLDAAMLR